MGVNKNKIYYYVPNNSNSFHLFLQVYPELAERLHSNFLSLFYVGSQFIQSEAKDTTPVSPAIQFIFLLISH